VIGVHGTGMDRVDHAGAAARGVRVVNTPGTNAVAVAELALALTLVCARDLPGAQAAARAGDAGFRDRRPGVELSGRQLGLVGFGHVARALIPMAKGLGMRTAVWSRRAAPAEIAAAGADPAADLDALCAEADVLSLHAVPDGPPLLDARRLGLMRPHAILVNTARGALVDEAALAAALRAGRLRAAALDATREEPPLPDSPLRDCPGLILTPHVGGATAEALERTALAVARLVLQALGRAP
jgi:phosphoglycerate dehydrogenase-like enzyme